MSSDLYADSAQARSWDQEELDQVSLEHTGGDTFAEQCRKKREREAEALRPRLKKAIGQMEAFFDGRKA